MSHVKRQYGLQRALPEIGREELLKMPTRALLMRLERLHRCEESVDASDLFQCEVSSDVGILFKKSSEWANAYRDIKDVLATREHVVSGPERKQTRVDRAERNRAKRKPRGW